MARKKIPTKKSAPAPFTLTLDETHPANVQVLASLASEVSARTRKLGAIRSPTSVQDPYMNCGSHPDVVERVWHQLGRALPEDGRCLLFGIPALVHPKSGVILAVCCGTAYAVRLPTGSARPPRQRLVRKWTDGGQTDIEAEFGAVWVFGDFSRGEVAAMKAVYQEFCD